MKFVLIVVAIVLAACAAAPTKKAHLSKEQDIRAKIFAAECILETGVNPELVMKAKQGHFTDDPALKKFSLCFFKKAGIVSSDGTLNVATALTKLPAGVDKVEAEKALQGCKDIKGQDAADKAFQIFKCYHKASTVHVAL